MSTFVDVFYAKTVYESGLDLTSPTGTEDDSQASVWHMRTTGLRYASLTITEV